MLSTACKKDKNIDCNSFDCLDDPPIGLVISKIVVVNYPEFVDGRNLWDSNTDADVYIDIAVDNTILLSTGYIEDAFPTSSHVFENDFPFLLEEMTTDYEIDLYDYDESSDDDWIGGFFFRPADYATGNFPRVITLNGTENQIDLELYVSWIF